MESQERKSKTANEEKKNITPEDGKKTLREIVGLIQAQITSLELESDAIIDEKDKLMQGCSKVAIKLRASYPLDSGLQDKMKPLQVNKSTSPITSPEIESFFQHPDIKENQSILDCREKVDLQIQLNEVRKRIDGIYKSLDDDSLLHPNFEELKKMLENFGESQSRTQKLVEKLYEDFETFCKRLYTQSDNSPEGNTAAFGNVFTPLPEGLQRLCNKIEKVVGLDYKRLARELGLDDEIQEKIETLYGDDEFEELFRQVIREWVKKVKTPTVHELVNACHRIDPQILSVKPLSKDKIDILETNMKFLCHEMLDVPIILPYLISRGILSLRLQKYVLSPNTRDLRIYRLMDVLYTRENGYDEFCNALDDSNQKNVADRLRGEEQLSTRHAESMTYQSILSLTEETAISGSVSKKEIEIPSSLDLPRRLSQNEVQDVLVKIATLLNKAGISPEND